MSRTQRLILTLPAVLALCVFGGVSWAEDAGKTGAILFANDLGAEEVDVSDYPEALQKTYRTTLRRCTKCHAKARILNSPFVELGKEELAALKKERPEVFDDDVFIAKEGLWKRYVKRMMRKPGSGIKKKDAKKIYQFLVHDSKARKTGENLDKWIEYRKGLLEEFKEKFPKKYEKHYGKKKH